MAVVKEGQYTVVLAEDDEVEGLISVSDIEWAGKTIVAADEAILTAGNGEVIFHGVARINNWSERKNLINKTYTGLKATTVDNGTLTIHLRRKG